jgi:hypothetical protein
MKLTTFERKNKPAATAAYAPAAGTPELSVVIILLEGAKSLVRCLSALAQQQNAPLFEVIVPCDDRFRAAVGQVQGFPFARVIAVEGMRTFAELRTLGVKQARGRIVALTEDHCVPGADWCRQIVQTHVQPYAAIGGAVEKLTPDSPLNWSFYLADYVRYMHPASAGPSLALTDCNVSYKRAVLAEIANVWAVEFHEPLVHHALHERGKILWFAPTIVVQQQRSLQLGAALRDRYEFGRLFGSERSAQAPLGQRLRYLLSSPLLPLLLVGRVAREIWRKRVYGLPFVRALPLLTLMCTVWAWGEFVGYLTGQPPRALSAQQAQAGGEPLIANEVR